MSEANALVHDSNELSVVDRIVGFSVEDRKRFAAKACAERNVEDLWALVRTQLMLTGATKHTLRSYQRGVKVIVEGFAGVNLLRVSDHEAQLLVMKLSEPVERGGHGLSPATVSARISAGAALYKALRWAGVTKISPFADVVKPRSRVRTKDIARKHALTEEELQSLIRYAEAHDKSEILVVLLLGAHSGLRVSEMLNLEWRDINVSDMRISVRLGKGKIDREARMSRSLLVKLNEWKQRLVLSGSGVGATDPVLALTTANGVYKALQRTWNKALPGVGVPGGSRMFQGRGVHGLRHYSGVRMARETRDLGAVRDHLGHQSVQTTEVYAGTFDDDDTVLDW